MAQAEEIRTETGPLDYDYTEKEVELCQENLQNHKACSPDKIKNEMLKSVPVNTCHSIHTTNTILHKFPYVKLQICENCHEVRGNLNEPPISTLVHSLPASSAAWGRWTCCLARGSAWRWLMRVKWLVAGSRRRSRLRLHRSRIPLCHPPPRSTLRLPFQPP
eukprot:g75077.t1